MPSSFDKRRPNVFKLGDYRPYDARNDLKAVQNIDWILEPGEHIADNHYGKVQVFGDDCVAIAERIVALLNAPP